MSKAFASIKQGLQEAIAHQQGRQAGSSSMCRRRSTSRKCVAAPV